MPKPNMSASRRLLFPLPLLPAMTVKPSAIGISAFLNDLKFLSLKWDSFIIRHTSRNPFSLETAVLFPDVINRQDKEIICCCGQGENCFGRGRKDFILAEILRRNERADV